MIEKEKIFEKRSKSKISKVNGRILDEYEAVMKQVKEDEQIYYSENPSIKEDYFIKKKLDILKLMADYIVKSNATVGEAEETQNSLKKIFGENN